MNNRLSKISNKAALYANLNSSSDVNCGPYWITQYTDKLVELMMIDIKTTYPGINSEMIRNMYNPNPVEHVDESLIK